MQWHDLALELIFPYGQKMGVLGMKVLRDEDDLATYSGGRTRDWWWVLHIFGGILLYTVISVTGISAALLSFLHGASHETASVYASAQALLSICVVLIGFKLSSELVKRHIDGRQISRVKRNLLKSALPFVYFVFAVLLATGIGPLFN